MLFFLKILSSQPHQYRRYLNSSEPVPRTTQRCWQHQSTTVSGSSPEIIHLESEDDLNQTAESSANSINENNAVVSSPCNDFNIGSLEHQIDTSTSSEINISRQPQIVDAIRLFILRSNMSLRNSKHLISLLNIVLESARYDSCFAISNLNSIIHPQNNTLLRSYRFCQDNYGEISNNTCHNCGRIPEKSNFISIWNLQHQLGTLLSDENVLNLIKTTKSKILNKTAGDLFQGEIYKELSPELGDFGLTFTINSDGFNINNTSKLEPWPIYFIINELGFKHRFSLKYVILLGIYYGKIHPNLNKLLQMCLENQMNIFTSGLTIGGNHYKFFITHASLDKPARSSLMEMTSHSSTLGCMFCFTQLKTLEVGRKKFKTFPFENALQLLREDDDFTATGISSTINSEMQFGQKRVTFFANFSNFKPVSGQIIDLLHCLFGGCVKKICLLMFDYQYRDESFSLYKVVDRINKEIEKLKPPSIFATRIRSFSNIKYFRAHEFRAFILFYGPILLKEFLPVNQFRNLMLLSHISYRVSM